MATAQVQIDRALRLLDQLNSGESGTAQESADGLIALNAMVGSWLANRDMGIVTLTTYATLATDQMLPFGYDDAIAQNLAIRLAPEYKFQISDSLAAGAGATLNFIRRGAAPAITASAQKLVNRALRLVGQIGPDEISTATESNYVFDDLNAMISSWAANRDMGIVGLVAFASLSTVQTLPSGYDDAIVYNLAVRIAPEYGKKASDDVIALSASTLKLIRRAAAPAPLTTAQSIINRALMAINQIGPDEISTATESNYGLVSLNSMIGSWLANRDMAIVSLVTYATLATDQASLPSGYDDAIVYNLAVRLAPKYKVNPSDALIALAANTLKIIRRAAAPAPTGTAQNIVNRALRMVGQIGPDEISTATESNYALVALNAMIGTWTANRDLGLVTLTTYATLATSQSLPAGYDDALAYNLAVRIGPEYKSPPNDVLIGLASDTLKFIRRAAAPAITGSAQKIVNRALQIIGQLGPDDISTVTESNYVFDALNSMIGSWIANRDMGIVSLTTYASLVTVQTLPSGYDDALAYNLALRVAPQYGKKSSDDTIALASSSLTVIRRGAAPAITATVQKIVNRALRMIGQIGADEISTTTESNYVFDILNSMLGSWRNEQLMCYAMQDESIPVSSGNATRTIGPSGNLVSNRPVSIKEAYITYSNVDSPVKVLEYDQYAYIPDKASTSTFPTRIYYKPEMPDGRIYLWPVPSASSVLHVLTETVVSSFASLTTTVALPPGWDDALAANLAVIIAPEFNRDIKPTVLAMARNAKRLIKRTNTRPIKSTNELVAISRRKHSNIISGI